MTHQQSLSTQMSSCDRFGDAITASWGRGTAFGVDSLLRTLYSIGERGKAFEGNFSIANHQPNLEADPSKRSGRYRLKVTVPK